MKLDQEVGCLLDPVAYIIMGWNGMEILSHDTRLSKPGSGDRL